MKKKIIIAGLLMGVLSLNSCVKDNESDAVRDQRNAQTEKLKAEAEKVKADAEYQKAQAEYQLVLAAKEKALGEVEVKAATISATLAELNLKVKQGAHDLNVEAEKIKAQADVHSATTTFVKAREKEELATSAYKASIEVLKEAAIKKAVLGAEDKLRDEVKSGLNSLVTDLGTKASQYTKTISDISTKEREIDDVKLSISKYKAGFLSFAKLYETHVQAQELIIAKNEAKIKAYKAKKTSVADAVSEKEAKEVEKLSLTRESYYLGKDASALFFNSKEAVEEFDLATSKLKFFEVLQEIQNMHGALVLKTAVKNIATKEVIEVQIDKNTPKTYDSYPKIEAAKANELVDYFVDSKELARQIKQDELAAAGKKVIAEQAKKNRETYQKGDYKTKKEAFEKAKPSDSDYVTKANDYASAETALNTLLDDEEKTNKEYEEASKLADLRAELDKEAKVLESKIADFLGKQDKVLASYEKYNDKLKEVEKVAAEVQAFEDVLSNDAMELTDAKINGEIAKAEKKIAKAEKSILEFENDVAKNPNSEQALNGLKDDLATKEGELLILKEKLRVYKEAYDAALEALKNYKG